MNYPNPIHFLFQVSKVYEYNVQARTVAKFFLETRFCATISIGCGFDVVRSLRAWE
jgi:hypothetical protein